MTAVRTPSPTEAPGRRRRWLPRLLVALTALVLLVALALGGIGWYYSGVLLTPDHSVAYTERVLAADRGSVTLARDTTVTPPGEYAIEWPGGRAVLGPVLRSSANSVVRSLLSGSAPAAGQQVAWSLNVAAGSPQQADGLAYQQVTFPSPLGAMPAWLVPAAIGSASGSAAGTATGAAAGTAAGTWAVLVHGRGATPQEGLRIMPTLHRLGLTVLDISYRNDVGAPASPDGFYHLGQTEWADVDAAVGYALDHGAKHVVLYGWSMGGALVETALDRSARVRAATVAVVLDAPVLDWRPTLDLQAADRNLPGFLTPIAELVTTVRAGISWQSMDALDRPVTVRTLLFHGDADRTVPVGPSRQWAARNRSMVTYVEVHGADHTAAWNVDPSRYEAAVAAFLG